MKSRFVEGTFCFSETMFCQMATFATFFACEGSIFIMPTVLGFMTRFTAGVTAVSEFLAVRSVFLRPHSKFTSFAV